MQDRTMPEPPADPPADDYTIAGGCGHEVYEGETLVEWHDGRKYVLLCEECFRDKLAEMTTPELARAFGCDCRVAGARGR
jgi:hypothetical protein